MTGVSSSPSSSSVSSDSSDSEVSSESDPAAGPMEAEKELTACARRAADG